MHFWHCLPSCVDAEAVDQVQQENNGGRVCGGRGGMVTLGLLGCKPHQGALKPTAKRKSKYATNNTPVFSCASSKVSFGLNMTYQILLL